MTDLPDHLIEITDDDGNVIQTIDMDLCSDVAMDVLSSLEDLEESEEEFDFVTAVFSLFIHSIHILNANGWSDAELIKEVQDHIHQTPPSNQLN
jgi:hypothetical protein